MPDVGLLTSAEPPPALAKVIIKCSVEVNGLPVYSETYNVKKIEQELKKAPNAVHRNWLRRIRCAAAENGPVFRLALPVVLLMASAVKLSISVVPSRNEFASG